MGERKGLNKILPPGSLLKIIKSLGIKVHKGDKIICPFHDDTDPSLKINKNNTWKCFGCHKSGTTYQFVKLFRKTNDHENDIQYIASVCRLDPDSLSTGEFKSVEKPVRCCVVDNVLYETVLQNGITRFVCLKERKTDLRPEISYHEEVIGEGVIYKPANGAEVEKGMVLLPDEVYPGVLNIKKIMGEIREFIHEFADMSEDFERICSYYVLMSWQYDRLGQLNYLSFLGDTGTGKSRCQDTVGSLCLCPIRINGGTTSAALYRITDKWKGTLLIDEADFGHSDETQDVVKLLNCGNEKNKPVAKCDKNDPNKIDFFDAYCPKIVSRRFDYKDKALESRMITEQTKETRRSEILNVLPNSFWDRARQLRNKLLAFRLRYYWSIDNPNSNLFDDLSIEPRLKQVFTSIGRVLERFPEAFSDLKAFMLEKSEYLLNERALSREGTLVHAFATLIRNGMNVITPTDLSLAMNEIAGSEDHDRWKYTSRGINGLLKALGFESKPIWHDGKTIRRITVNHDVFVLLCERYHYDLTTLTTPCVDSYLRNNSIMNAQPLRPLHVSTCGRKGRNVVRNSEELTAWVESNDHYGNYEKAIKIYGEDAIVSALAKGDIFQHRNDWLKKLA